MSVSSRISIMFAIALAVIAPIACAAADSNQSAPAAPATTDPVATVNGEPITAAQLNEAVGGRISALDQQIYQTKVDGIRGLAFQRVLEAVAKAADQTPEAYYKLNVADKVTEPAEQMVTSVLNQYRTQLPSDEAQARAQVVAYLKQQQARTLEEQLRSKLLGEANLVVLLDPPRQATEPAPFDPAKGPADAPVVMVEFSDYQCPFCRRAQPVVNEVMKRYDGKIRHVYRQLPLEMHDNARTAAEASLCAADQGKFWELHDWMFQHQQELDAASLKEKAGGLGLDAAVFATCLDEKKHAAEVDQDMAEAQRLGISGTPGFVINGRLISGAQPLATFTEIVNDELRRAGVEIPAEPKEAAPAPAATPAS